MSDQCWVGICAECNKTYLSMQKRNWTLRFFVCAGCVPAFRKRFEDSGMTKTDFAKSLGLDVATINKILRGKR